MKRTIVVLMILAVVALAGDMVSGGSELTKFSGHASFRFSMFGEEDPLTSSTMSTYSYVNWVPKLNDYVDGKIGATVTTPTVGTSFDVCYAYLNLHFTDNFTLSAGQMNIPFGYAYTRSSGSMLFADRASMVTNPPGSSNINPLPGYGDFGLYGGKDNMAMLTVNYAPVTVDLAFSNGNGTNFDADTTVNKQFTARLAVEPTEWLTVGGSVAMIGQPELTLVSGGPTTDSWSSNGIDVFAVANYPLSSTGTINFVGEYMMLGYPSNDVTGFELHDGARMSIMGGYDMELDGEVILAVQPAVRFDTIDPIATWADTATEPEDNQTIIDFCVGVDLFTNLNTLQLGMRNYSWENDDVATGGTESYNDMYVKWRMNF